MLGLSKWVHKAAITIVELLRPIPSVALIPLAILVWGRGTEMKVALIVYACVWPILFNTIYGTHHVDPIGADTARVFGMGRAKTMVRVYLPAAAPFIFTGVRIAASVALILAVSTEIVAGGANGLGIQLELARNFGDLKLSYAFTIVTGLIGLAMHSCFEAIERRQFAWATQAAGVMSARQLDPCPPRRHADPARRESVRSSASGGGRPPEPSRCSSRRPTRSSNRSGTTG